MHGHGKVIGRLWREEDIDGLLLEGRVIGVVVDLDDVQLIVNLGHSTITFAPVAFLTANVKSFVLDGAPSS